MTDRFQIAVIEERYGINEAPTQPIVQFGGFDSNGFANDRFRKAHYLDNSTTLLNAVPVSTVPIPVELDSELAATGSFGYALAGDAVDGTHYRVFPGSESPLSIPPGMTSTSIRIEIDPQGLSGTQWFREKLLSIQTGTLSGMTAGLEREWKLYIRPVAPPPRLSWVSSGQTVAVGAASIVVNRTGETQEDITIYYTLGGTLVPGPDYSIDAGSEPGVLTIPAGQASATLGLNITTGSGTIIFTIDHERSDGSDENEWTFTHDWTLDQSQGSGLRSNFAAEPTDHVNGGGGFRTDVGVPDGVTGTVILGQESEGVAPGNVKLNPDGEPIQGVQQSEWIAINGNESTKPGATQWYIREVFDNQLGCGGPVKLDPLVEYQRASFYVDTWPAPFDGDPLSSNSKNSRFVRLTLRNRSKDLNHAVMFDRQSTGVDWQGNSVGTVTTQTGVWGLWRASKLNPNWALWGSHFGVVEETINGQLRTRLWLSHFVDESLVYENAKGQDVQEELGVDGMNPIHRLTYFQGSDGSDDLAGPPGVLGRFRGLLTYWPMYERSSSPLAGPPARFWEKRRNWWEPRGNATADVSGFVTHTITVT